MSPPLATSTTRIHAVAPHGAPHGAPRAVTLALAAVLALPALGLSLGTPQAQARPAPESFAPLVKEVAPAVVNVQVALPGNAGAIAGRQLPFQFQVPEGTPFGEFFEKFFGPESPFMQPGPDQEEPGAPHGQRQGKGPKMTSVGSGFIIDAGGLVVTNNHVVGDDRAEDAEIQVTLTDGRQLPAKLLGRDPKTDLALLKIESSSPLPSVRWGDSDKMEVGDWVLAVGNPFGLGGSVTAGIVSARGRDIRSGPYDDFLQVDAAINRGNSGGPSFNSDGQVVGINTAIYSPNGGSIGIGFAIPSNLAREVIEQLKSRGSVQRGWLGVQIQAVSPDMAEAVGLDKARGAIVNGIDPDGPAKPSGLKPGDVIIRFAGQPVNEMRELPRLVAAQAPGARVDVVVWRERREVPLTVRLGELKDQPKTAALGRGQNGGQPEKGRIAPLDYAGLSLSPVTPELSRRYSIPAGTEGAVVLSVAPGAPGAEAGLRPGDVITAVSSEATASPDAVKQQLEAAKAKRRPALLAVSRGGSNTFLTLRLAQG